jgi:hypothetical protein
MTRSRTATRHLSPRGAVTTLTRSSRWQALDGAAVVAGFVGALAAAPMPSGPTAGASVPARQALGMRGELHLVIWSVDSDCPDFEAVLSWAIGDYGAAVTVFPDKGRPQHSSEMETRAPARDVPALQFGDSKQVPGSDISRAGVRGDVFVLPQRHCRRPHRGGFGHGPLPWDTR